MEVVPTRERAPRIPASQTYAAICLPLHKPYDTETPFAQAFNGLVFLVRGTHRCPIRLTQLVVVDKQDAVSSVSSANKLGVSTRPANLEMIYQSLFPTRRSRDPVVWLVEVR
jgi:hypothetical protein